MGGAAAMTTPSSVVPSLTALITWPLPGQAPAPGAVAGLVLGFGAVLTRHHHLFEFCRPDGSRRTGDRWVTLIE